MRGLLVSERIRLCAVEETDLGVISGWFNDVEFMRHYDMVAAVPQNRETVRRMIERYHASDTSFVFSIRAADTGDIIGIAGFDEIIWSNATATVFIGIGDRAHRGKGLGSEALRLLLEFGFAELNFHKLQLSVIAYNKAAISMYENSGFVREGVLRQFINRSGIRHDMYLYGLLKNEWERDTAR